MPASSRRAADFNKPGRHVLGRGRRAARSRASRCCSGRRPKVITTTGQVSLGAEPVRAKRADVWMSGDSDVILFAKRNASWAHVIEPEQADRQAPEHVGGALRRPRVEAASSTSAARSWSSTARWSGCSSSTWRSWARRDARVPPPRTAAGALNDHRLPRPRLPELARRLRPSLSRPPEVPAEGRDAPGGARPSGRATASEVKPTMLFRDGRQHLGRA